MRVALIVCALVAGEPVTALAQERPLAASAEIQAGELEALERRIREEPADVASALERIRVLYLLAIESQDRLHEARAAVDSLDARVPSDDRVALTLEAYRGALDVLRGKHAFWPHSKIDHVRDGLATLDAVARRAPDHVEARYLRLVSCVHLPFFFSRGQSVREDTSVLATLLGTPPRLAERFRAHAIALVLASDAISESAKIAFSARMVAP